MVDLIKGSSPFYPGQPVPVELFVGRLAQIKRILQRGVGQVAAGKPASFYVQGEYGIGKSSIARFTQFVAERDSALHPIYASLGGAKNLDDVAAAILEGTFRSGAFDANRGEKIRSWLSKYVGDQTLFGFGVNLKQLKIDAPSIASPFGILGFLTEALSRLRDDGMKGIFLVLDEINGITADPQFAHFIKTIVDSNAMAPKPLPLLLMLCGVEERRREMIQKHQPIDRVFDVVEVEALTRTEMEQFFTNAFGTVQTAVDPGALNIMTHYAAGFPKIMHLIGDAAFWQDDDQRITTKDAATAVFTAADDVGKKYVDQQIYKALKSADYRSILAKIAKMGPDVMAFRRSDVAKDLSDGERKKFDNFLQKMKALNVLRSGDGPGEYEFNQRMVRFYVWLRDLREVVSAQQDTGPSEGD